MSVKLTMWYVWNPTVETGGMGPLDHSCPYQHQDIGAFFMACSPDLYAPLTLSDDAAAAIFGIETGPFPMDVADTRGEDRNAVLQQLVDERQGLKRIIQNADDLRNCNNHLIAMYAAASLYRDRDFFIRAERV